MPSSSDATANDSDETLKCVACCQMIHEIEPLVYADSTGRGLAATDPFHVYCYFVTLPEPEETWQSVIAAIAGRSLSL